MTRFKNWTAEAAYDATHRAPAKNPKGKAPVRAVNVRAYDAIESAYANVLEMRKRAGEVEWYAFEGMKFRLADNTFYTPDFSVMLTSGQVELHEVKGFWTDDARVKIKVAASLFPFQFIAVYMKGAAFSYENF